MEPHGLGGLGDGRIELTTGIGAAVGCQPDDLQSELLVDVPSNRSIGHGYTPEHPVFIDTADAEPVFVWGLMVSVEAGYEVLGLTEDQRYDG